MSRHRFVFNYVVDLPFGAGRRFGGGATGISNTLISGWTLSGFTTLQAGYPARIYGNPQFDRLGLRIAPERRSELRQARSTARQSIG